MGEVKSVGLFAWVEFEGDLFQVVEIDGPTLTLERRSDGTLREMDVSELFDGAFTSVDDEQGSEDALKAPGLASSAVLDGLSSEEAERVKFLQRHVHEFCFGVPFVYDGSLPTPNPDYYLSVPLKTRLAIKVQELKGTDRPLSVRSLEKYMAAYRRDGVAGLLDGRSHRTVSGVGRADPRLVEILRRRIAAETDRSTGQRKRLINEATIEFKKTFRGEKLKLPSRASMYRLVASLEGGSHAFGSAKARQSKARQPKGTFGGQRPSRPGQLVEIDSSTLDVLAVLPDGTIGKVDVTALVDVATRVPLATVLRPVASKAVDATALLLRAMTPIVDRPGWQDLLEMSRNLLPPEMVPNDHVIMKAAADWPVLVPESITVDRGKVFVGDTFLNATQSLSISVVKAPPRTPTGKGHIERLFGTAITEFAQYLRGYKGISVQNRGVDPAGEALWTIPELQVLLDVWLLAVWQYRPHSSLSHPAAPKRKLSPQEMFQVLAGVAPQSPVRPTRDQFIGTLPRTLRTINHYGINCQGLTYRDPDGRVANLHGRKSGLPVPNSNKYEVRFDPYNLTVIWVWDTHASEWIEVPWVLAGQFSGPFSTDMLKAAKKALTSARSKTPTDLDLLRQLMRIQEDPATKSERRARNRSDGGAGLIPPPEPQPEPEEEESTMEDNDTDSDTAARPTRRKFTPMKHSTAVFKPDAGDSSSSA